MTPAPITIITSAAYINDELAAEFGHLPSSFLPFGHNRLFQDQVARLKTLADADERIVLTIPASFAVPEWELSWFEKNQVELLALPDGLSLCQSILQALILIDARGPVKILHGDTLFLQPLPPELDVVGVSPASDGYTWGRLGSSELTASRADMVLTGWFSFSSAPTLLQELVQSGDSFTRALDAYDARLRLTQVKIDDWLDFGHLQTFYRARARISTARSFNSVRISEHTVVKTGGRADKLEAEATWFETIPTALRLHTPPFLGRESGGYGLGYEVSPTLHELFVFGQLGPSTWRQILEGCFTLLDKCVALGANEAASAFHDIDAVGQLATGKTLGRLAEWAEASGIDLDRSWRYAGRLQPSLREIAETTAQIACQARPVLGIMHGDFCFPNMFYNFRQGLIKVIDPRGSVQDGTHTPLGDIRYDLAKLNHSLEGYDLILAGRYDLQADDYDTTITFPSTGTGTFLPAVAAEFSCQGQGLQDPSTIALTVHLFLSMLPLHADRPDRQSAFIANALRLFESLGAPR